MNRRLGGDSSLNTKAYDNDDEAVERIDLLADKSQNIEMSLAAKQEVAYKKQILAKSMEKLNEREQYIIKHRMLTENPLTLDEIGEKFNISRERVRQIEKRAFEKLSAEVKSFMAAE